MSMKERYYNKIYNVAVFRILPPIEMINFFWVWFGPRDVRKYKKST